MATPLPLTATPPPAADLDPALATTDDSSAKPPTLTFYHHPLSPFARKVWMTALEHNLTSYITLRQITVAPVETPKVYPGWSEHNEMLGKFNPIAKIPTLVVNEGQEGQEYAVYDSKIICEYLVDFAEHWTGARHEGVDTGSTKNATYWKRQSLHRCADQMMDSEILVAYEERMREAEGIKWEPWIVGMRKKIERGVGVIMAATRDGTLTARDSQESRTPGTLSGDEVAVACCLGFIEVRSIKWPEHGVDPESSASLQRWYEAIKLRDSWKSSKADAGWKGREV